jgi:hypothetical protein
MNIKEKLPKMVELSTKAIILISLCLQNCLYTLLRKYSTKYEDVSYKEILLLSEVIKIIFSMYMIIYDKDQSKSDADGVGLHKLLWLLRNSRKM